MKNRNSRLPGVAGLFLLAFVIPLCGLSQSPADSTLVRCATDELERIKIERSPSYRTGQVRSESLIQQYITRNKANLRTAADEVIRIPVVVHVIHSQVDNRIGGADNSNISDEQVRSQITVLNEDYRRKPGTNGFNSNPVGADTQIEFELAQYDPDGRKINGITRTYSKTSRFSPVADDDLLAGIISWPSDKYLNIWVCTLNSGYLGVAQLPSNPGCTRPRQWQKGPVKNRWCDHRLPLFRKCTEFVGKGIHYQ
jgi:hypothetical protein